jgi:biofilm PGA synthesis protein PgaA
LERLRKNSNDEVTQRDTEIISAMFEAYQNRLQEAQTRLEKLQKLYPDNADIQLRLAQIYRWRGWPRRALAAYRSVEERASDKISVQVGEVAALNDMHAFKEADEQLRQLIATAPHHPEIMRAQQEQLERKRWDYSAQVVVGKSTDNPVTGGRDIAFEQKLYSPPLAEQFRAFVHQRYDWADFPEGAGSADRLGVGGDYRSPNADVSMEISNRNPSSEIGLTADGEWKFNDRLSVFGEVQTDSNQVPLRALNADIDGHSATIGALYRVDEAHALRASYSRADFSDGNRRNAILAQYEQRLFAGAHDQLTGILQGYYSDNSAGNEVPYFNPDSEQAIGAALKYEGILSRRYERSWSHYVQLGVGNYAQQHFGSGVIWDAEYGQRWQLSQGLSLNYGVLYRSRIYDGSREGYGALVGGVNWRF